MYQVKILLDSVAPTGARLTTFEVTLPRIVLAELNTHRMLSKNSASSRAIPVEKQIKKIEEDPFLPVYWGKNQKGMQADEEFDEEQKLLLNKKWVSFSLQAVAAAWDLLRTGVHKQITNRLLEPFMWHTVIVTATEWRNFFALRDSKMAQPEIQRAANMMRKWYMRSTPQELPVGSWHLPLVTGVDHQTLINEGVSTQDLIKISCARCARVSYLTHDGKRDIQADLDLYARLIKDGHMSPLEHAARALSESEWKRVGANMMELWLSERIPPGNFWGFFQYRKSLTMEHEFPRGDIFWKEEAA